MCASREDSVKRWRVTCKSRPGKSILPAPWSWTFSLENCKEKIADGHTRFWSCDTKDLHDWCWVCIKRHLRDSSLQKSPNSHIFTHWVFIDLVSITHMCAVWVYACVYGFVVGAHVWMCIWTLLIDVKCHSPSLFLLFIDTGSLHQTHSLLIWLILIVSLLQDPLPLPLRLALQASLHNYPAFTWGSRYLN